MKNCRLCLWRILSKSREFDFQAHENYRIAQRKLKAIPNIHRFHEFQYNFIMGDSARASEEKTRQIIIEC